MQTAIKNEIKRLSKRLFLKQLLTKKTEEKYRLQFQKRTNKPAGQPNKRPSPPVVSHYDPAYCARHANFLAATIWNKVINKKYDPKPAVRYQIPKPDGTKREIMAFSIPDAALANVVLRRTRERNLKRLSPSSYAYHPQKNVFDAILALKEFDHGGKLFAVQIDFEKYFDSIPTQYLEKKISDSQQVSLTPHERYVFSRFMRHQFSDYKLYGSQKFKRRHKGTPQGSSVSLILANLANHDLDVKLTASAGRFVRFADDIVALCSDYSHAQAIERCFLDHCRNSGLIINSRKSPGISIISEAPQEIRTDTHLDYLGYRIRKDGLSMPEKTIKKLKTKISRLINIYLLNYIDLGFNNTRCGTNPSYDWDLLGLIYELRNSLYGGLSEDDLSTFINSGKRLPKMNGLMGFYCLLDDPQTLRHLDGWMLSVIRRAMVVRNIALQDKYGCACPTPSNKQLALGSWLDLKSWRGNITPDPRAPSLVRGWRSARKHFYTFGLEKVQAPGYSRYSDIGDLFDYS